MNVVLLHGPGWIRLTSEEIISHNDGGKDSGEVCQQSERNGIPCFFNTYRTKINSGNIKRGICCTLHNTGNACGKTIRPASFFAHQVNELENTQLSVGIESDGQKYRVTTVAVLMTKQIGPPREAVARLRTVAEKLRTEAQARFDVLKMKVMEDAQERLDAHAQKELSA